MLARAILSCIRMFLYNVGSIKEVDLNNKKVRNNIISSRGQKSLINGNWTSQFDSDDVNVASVVKGLQFHHHQQISGQLNINSIWDRSDIRTPMLMQDIDIFMVVESVFTIFKLNILALHLEQIDIKTADVRL